MLIKCEFIQLEMQFVRCSATNVGWVERRENARIFDNGCSVVDVDAFMTGIAIKVCLG